MVIKNKNGTVYKVRGPNPLMKTQDVWDDFILHNMKFDPEIIKNQSIQPKKTKKIEIGSTQTIKDDFAEPVILPKIEPKKSNSTNQEFKIPDFSEPEPTPIPKIVEDDTDVLKPTSINEMLADYPKDIMNCMLANTSEKIDPLYEEKKIKITYVRNFVFENIIINMTDMELVFWSHLDFITKNSIVYPKNDSRRWWKIDKVRKGPEGTFFSCVPTQTQPNFKG